MSPSVRTNLGDQQYNEAKAAWNYRSQIWRQRMNIMRQQQQQLQQRSAKKAAIPNEAFMQQYPWQQQRRLYVKNNVPKTVYDQRLFG